MLVLKIIGVILLFLFFLTLISIRVSISYKEEVLMIKAGLGFIKVRILPRKELSEKKKIKAEIKAEEDAKKEAEKKEKKAKEKPETEKAKEKKTSKLELKDLLDILRGAKTALVILKKHFHVSKLYANIEVGGENAHITGVNYGNMMTIASAGLAVLSEFLHIRIKKIYIEPNYLIENSSYDLSLSLRIRPIWIIVAAVSFLFNFAKVYFSGKSKTKINKGGNLNESKSN